MLRLAVGEIERCARAQHASDVPRRCPAPSHLVQCALVQHQRAIAAADQARFDELLLAKLRELHPEDR